MRFDVRHKDSAYAGSALHMNWPRDAAIACRRSDLLTKSLLDHWLPWSQTESLAVVEHDATPIDTADAPPVSHGSMLKAGASDKTP